MKNGVLKITLWNVEWAQPETPRGQLVSERLFAGEPDVVCVAEGYPAMLAHEGHVILADADHGYGTTDGRRKVMLWSRNPWTAVDTASQHGFPSGRFVSGITDTPLGAVQFIAVCIPWKSAHVSTGQRNRALWEEHTRFLDSLAGWLKVSDLPTVLLGDFNQRIPRVQQPVPVYERLLSALGADLRVVTGGLLVGAEFPVIDHIAISNALAPAGNEVFSAQMADGTRLSDHSGIRARLSQGEVSRLK